MSHGDAALMTKKFAFKRQGGLVKVSLRATSWRVQHNWPLSTSLTPNRTHERAGVPRSLEASPRVHVHTETKQKHQMHRQRSQAI
jgi:hypothetical protein